MAQTGYTPILIYSSSTAAAAPAAGSLTNSTLGSELAINITDGKLFYKDNANAVQVIGWKTVPTSAGGTGLTSYAQGDLIYYNSGTTFTALAKNTTATRYLSNTGANNNPAWAQIDLTNGVTGTLPSANGGTGLASFTANQVFYASSTSAVAQSANLTFNGTTLTVNDLTDSSLTANRVVYASTGGNLVTSANLTFNGTTFTHTGASNFATSTGNVGIGTSSPNTTLETVGTIRASRSGVSGTFMEMFGGSGAADPYINVPSGFGVPFLVNGVERARFNAGAPILCLAGGNASATGTGIAFPATASVSTDVNTLDDYEEGTWNPTLTGLTIGNATGVAYRYVKIGQVCLVTLNFTWGSTSTSTGDWGFSLPFTAQDSGGGAAYCLDSGTAAYALASIVATGAYGSELRISDGTGAGFLGGTNPFTWASGDLFQMGLVYRTST